MLLAQASAPLTTNVVLGIFAVVGVIATVGGILWFCEWVWENHKLWVIGGIIFVVLIIYSAGTKQ